MTLATTSIALNQNNFESNNLTGYITLFTTGSEPETNPAIASISVDNTPPSVYFTANEFDEGNINLSFKIQDEITGVKSQDSIIYEITNNEGFVVSYGNPKCSTECINNPAQICYCEIISANTFEAGNYNLTINATDSA
ncbi:MAG: hypothetical protein KAS30_03260, partial [Candidatus Diapherotrites archaeon]|nr:hypothetical protein [Candidatus Diapherotrites archaeon]